MDILMDYQDLNSTDHQTLELVLIIPKTFEITVLSYFLISLICMPNMVYLIKDRLSISLSLSLYIYIYIYRMFRGF